jgi:hypothetical protein
MVWLFVTSTMSCVRLPTSHPNNRTTKARHAINLFIFALPTGRRGEAPKRSVRVSAAGAFGRRGTRRPTALGRRRSVARARGPLGSRLSHEAAISRQSFHATCVPSPRNAPHNPRRANAQPWINYHTGRPRRVHAVVRLRNLPSILNFRTRLHSLETASGSRTMDRAGCATSSRNSAREPSECSKRVRL